MNRSRFSIISLCLLMMFSIAANGQDRDPIYITLSVNTSNLTARNMNQNASFGQDEEVSNEDFNVNVRLGDTVIWEGQSTSSEDDFVEILSINYEGGARLFDRNVLNGEDGVVTATVSQGRNGDVEKYTIKFRVTRNGEVIPGVFQIDPKLTVKQ